MCSLSAFQNAGSVLDCSHTARLGDVAFGGGDTSRGAGTAGTGAIGVTGCSAPRVVFAEFAGACAGKGGGAEEADGALGPEPVAEPEGGDTEAEPEAEGAGSGTSVGVTLGMLTGGTGAGVVVRGGGRNRRSHSTIWS